MPSTSSHLSPQASLSSHSSAALAKHLAHLIRFQPLQLLPLLVGQRSFRLQLLDALVWAALALLRLGASRYRLCNVASDASDVRASAHLREHVRVWYMYTL